MGTLGIRKLVVAGLVGTVFLTANFLLVANWLHEKGLIGWAKGIRKEYLTGTAITTIVALLILIVGRRGGDGKWLRRCPVCGHRVPGSPSYCSDCGSKLSASPAPAFEFWFRPSSYAALPAAAPERILLLLGRGVSVRSVGGCSILRCGSPRARSA